MEGASKTLLLGTNDLKQLGIDIDSLLAKLAEEESRFRRESDSKRIKEVGLQSILMKVS